MYKCSQRFMHSNTSKSSLSSWPSVSVSGGGIGGGIVDGASLLHPKSLNHFYKCGRAPSCFFHAVATFC